MIDYIDSQNKIFEEILKVFKNNRKGLIKIQEGLQESFEELIDLFSKDYKLVAQNDLSVNPTKYYHVKSRVKTPHSFKEKLYRKNIGLQISSKNALTIENFDSKHTKVRKSIFLLDDIIGIRIVTELKNDCNYAYNLIRDKKHFFADRDIDFNQDEIDKQPEIMKNGLPIFRIKGVFMKQYGFELQIKSKIDEAWGDMDHSLFYKDYSISPIRNTVQITMNNVGYLLEKIEELLLGLRNSENDYKEKKEEIDFLNELSGSVFKEIKNKLGDNYDLSKIASSIKFIQARTKIKSNALEIKKLGFSFLNYQAKDKRSIDYVQNRNLNFELLILESLYWYWKKKADSKFKLTKNNYNNKLNDFVELLIDNLHINTKNIQKVDYFSISKKFIIEIIETYSNVDLVIPLLLDPKTIYQLTIIDSLLADAISEYSEESEDFIERKLDKEIHDIYFTSLLNQDISKTVNQLKNNMTDKADNHLINKFVFDLNKIIQRQLNNYKLDDNEKALKEVRFVEDLLKKTLLNIKQENK